MTGWNLLHMVTFPCSDVAIKIIGSLTCRRFRGDGDVTTGWTGSEVAVLPPKFKLVKIMKTAAATSWSLLLCSPFFCLGMATFKEFRLLLLRYHDAKLIGDEEFVLLYMFPSKNPSFPYHEYARFDLDYMSEADCKAQFRFEKKDLPVLAAALQIPPSFKL